MVIDHIGIAVKSIDDARKIWEDAFGYRAMTEIVINSRQQVKVQFLTKAGSICIKLIEPINEASPAFSAVKQNGGGLHHLCFKCDDLEESLSFLQQKGLRIITKPQPGEAFENERIAFLYARMGLNIEVIDTEKRARLKE